MLDFNKKYEYSFILHLQNHEKLKILYFSDNQYIDEVFEEFLKDKTYIPINIIKKDKLIPGYINTFNIEYIENI